MSSVAKNQISSFLLCPKPNSWLKSTLFNAPRLAWASEAPKCHFTHWKVMIFTCDVSVANQSFTLLRWDLWNLERSKRFPSIIKPFVHQIQNGTNGNCNNVKPWSHTNWPNYDNWHWRASVANSTSALDMFFVGVQYVHWMISSNPKCLQSNLWRSNLLCEWRKKSECSGNNSCKGCFLSKGSGMPI